MKVVFELLYASGGLAPQLVRREVRVQVMLFNQFHFHLDREARYELVS